METLSEFLRFLRTYGCSIEVELRHGIPVIIVRSEGKEFELGFQDPPIECLRVRDTVNNNILNIDDFEELADLILDEED